MQPPPAQELSVLWRTKLRSTLPDVPVSHPHTVRAYLGEDAYRRLTQALPKRNVRRKPKAAE